MHSGVATVGPGRACALPKICANIDASNFAGTRTTAQCAAAPRVLDMNEQPADRQGPCTMSTACSRQLTLFQCSSSDCKDDDGYSGTTKARNYQCHVNYMRAGGHYGARQQIEMVLNND